ncbi:MAG: MG2 domain-containing protein [Planctomycetota bacterium]|nr:MG2 domain-containing protein [Planctomycetota bacterium]
MKSVKGASGEGGRSAPSTAARWATLIAAVGLLNGGALWWMYDGMRRGEPVLEVEEFSPRGEARPDDEIRVRFTGDVVPSSSDDASPADGLVQLIPEVPGRTRWDGLNGLVFRASSGLPRATPLRVLLSERIGALVGRRLEGPREFSFWTEPLKLLGVRQVGFTRELSATVSLQFNDVVASGDLREHLELLDRAGATIDYDLESDAPAASLVVRTQPGVDHLTLRVAAGLRGQGGPLGLEHGLEIPVPLTYRLRLQSAHANAAFRESPEITLQFNNRVDAALAGDVDKYFRIEPAVPFEASVHCCSSRVTLRGGFEPGRSYGITVLRGLPGVGHSVLLDDVRREVRVPDRPARVAFLDTAGYLSPRGSGRVAIVSSNVPRATLTADRVLPENLVHYLSIENRWFDDHFLDRGKTMRIDFPSRRNQLLESAVELEEILGEDIRGVWKLSLSVRDPARGSSARSHDQLLVSATDLALSVKAERDGYLVWVTSLASGAPVSGAKVRVVGTNNRHLATGTSGDDGLVRLRRPAADGSGKGTTPYLITAEKDGDLSYLALEDGRLSVADFDVRGRPILHRGYEAYLFSERGVLRPGETLHVAAIVRDAALYPPRSFPLELEVLRPDRRRLGLFRGVLGTEGSASWEVRIPESARTGRYRAGLRIPGDNKRWLGSVEFLVEDFLADRLRVRIAVSRAGDAASPEPPPPSGVGRDSPEDPGSTETAAGPRYRVGERLRLEIHGEHLAGLPASGARSETSWTLVPETFAPPRWKGFHFGNPRERETELKGSLGHRDLDDLGVALHEFEIPRLASSTPLRLELRAEVEDASGRPVSAETTLQVDSRPFYLGIRSLFEGPPPVGKPMRFQVAAVRPDGDAEPLPSLELKVGRLAWASALRRTSSGRYEYQSSRSEEAIDSRTVSLEDGRGELSVVFSRSADYRLTVTDPGSGASAELELWAAEGGWTSSPRLEKPERLEIDVARSRVRPGSRVRAVVRAPFAGTLLLTTETDRVIVARVVRMKGNQQAVEVEVPRRLHGNLYITATVVRGSVTPEGVTPENGASGAAWTARRAFGIEPLWIDHSPEELTVTIETPPLLRPRSRGVIRVRVHGADGSPAAGAEVVLALVDEGILSRTAHDTPDPWSFFYAKRAHEVVHSDVYGSLLPEVPLETNKARPGGGSGRRRERARRESLRRLSPVKARRVQPVALWLGRLRTDENGEILRDFELPPFTGELRAMAVAHSENRFGSSRARVVVRGPLHLELGLPRFLAPSDRFVAALEVTNTTTRDAQARLDWTVSGPLAVDTLERSPGVAEVLQDLPLELAPGERHRFERRLLAAARAGPAKVTATGRIGAVRVEETVEIPVRPVALPVRRTTSGGVRSDEPLEFVLEDGFVAGTANHRLVFAPRPDLDLLGSLSYVLRYPHGCLEQTTSRAFPLLRLADLAALLREGYGRSAADGLPEAEEEIDLRVQAGIERILSMQGAGGWLATWPGGRSPWKWASAYAAHFLVEARKAGHDVPREELDELLDYLRDGLVRARPGRATMLERSYAAFVLAVAGREEARRALEPLDARAEERREVGDESSGWGEARFLVGAAWMALGEGERARRILGEELPPPELSRQLGGSLRSPARQAAILLSVAVDVDAHGPRVAALVERLKDYRVGGHWSNTQENAFALLALGKYAALVQKAGQNYTATIEVGEREPLHVTAGETRVVEGDLSGSRVRVTVEGDGTLYWFLREEGVPADGRVEEVDSGLRVRRRFLDAAGAELPEARFERGQLIQVEIRLETARRLENLVVVDLPPAGLEVENPRLRGARRLVERGEYPLEPSHLDIRDDRVILHFDLPRRGAATYRYAARAVTAGEFALPVVMAESLYDPGIYSRHGAGTVRVTDAR